ITIKKTDSMSSSGNGGSSPPGKDMIFRVKSPIKLYWLAQLYDLYDGNEWFISDELKSKSEAKDTNLKSKVISYNVEQNVIVEKWVSNKLYAAYRPVLFDSASSSSASVKIDYNFYQGWLKDKNYPALPFRYRVNSELYLPNVKAGNENGEPVNYWVERLPRKHYLRLPREKISSRLKLLTKRLTQNVQGPFEKAIILRNYLRENFKYQQFSKQVPPGREAVDYFIFELREGHCEYYASSLTVMARLAGLPARVAVGFSPGNYNALNGYFEVHQYHAHAWTQIYIEKMGWITFDATPPGEIISNTTPFAIGSLRDPFGDSWRIMPPELTKQALNTLRKGLYDTLSQTDGEDLSIAEKALVETAMAPEKIQEKLRNMLNSAMPKVKGDGFEKLKNIYDDLKKSLAAMLDNAGSKIAQLWSWSKKKWKIAFPLIMIVAAIYMEVKILSRYFYRRRLLRKCRDWYRRALELAIVSPNETVRLCYLTIRELLVLASYPRHKNAELFEYGTSLSDCDLHLAKDVVVAFFVYSKYEYGTEKVSVEDCAEILERTARVRKFIYPLIKEKDELEIPAHPEFKQAE
ncbi:MAG: transglutaminase-like domain-containing protein, partial [Victivallaceae bacterium]